MLSINFTKLSPLLLPLLTVSLTGCGLTQSVADGTKSTFSSIFHKNIKILHLDFVAREALNTDAAENDTHAESVMIRVYQLKTRQAFDQALYQQLVRDDERILKNDLLSVHEVVLKPAGAATLDVPMNGETKFVAVVGLFRQPDMEINHWKDVLEREAFDPERARVIEAAENSVKLLPAKDH